ncbi:MAG: hypothetical protein KME05_23855 [Gloeocapsa sp. UFS-A4-WI-NPMV-4B04]|jgi:hypothetical protein|nr:hypothetical protein [Gloeocapsa sp. UFS-A4-WI-NPMV-4B04]
MDIPNNAFRLFNNYRNYYQKNGIPLSLVYKTQMALLYCVVPMLGGARIKGQRSTKEEIKAAMSFLESISLDQFINVAQSTKVFMEKENIPKNKQREYWTYLKKLLNWANEQQYILNNQPSFVNELPVNHTSCTRGEIQAKDKNINMFGEKAALKYTAGYHSRDYFNFALRNQLEDYRKFLIEERGLCNDYKSSVHANITITNLLLRWLHTEKNIPVDDLCLESIIPLLETKPKRADFKDIKGIVNQSSYLKAKNKLEQQARERSEETILLIKSFLDFNSKSLITRSNILGAIINIAKFIYRNNTNAKIAKNFEDIYIIKLLRNIKSAEINNFKMKRRNKSTNIRTNTGTTKHKVGYS